MSSLTSSRAPLTSERRGVLSRRIRIFVAATITYNIVEAIVAIAAGTVASSSALIAFGLDSVIEVTSAAAVAWQFSARDPQAREKTALRFIAFSFFGLALFVGFDAVRALITGAEASHSAVGIVLAAVSLAVMPLLSYLQRRAGRELGSKSAVADSKQTLLCSYLSGVLLVGLLLNSLLGWSWADPIAALVIAGWAIKEGREAWRVMPAAQTPSRSTRPRPRRTPAAAPAATDTFPLFLSASERSVNVILPARHDAAQQDCPRLPSSLRTGPCRLLRCLKRE
ncbi:Co/Zn/Cd efflux system component [Arthrobacter pigmenti]|uniref:Co/Zn/Cd efflux system component n=1 Tax=Arthrobacter pigmenti TaxID=271432 RepID=A0A846RR14_9MICC|nr:Co/Zn/Cd efflux system component [Arthrobacter pigmenti]